ncbi:Mitochondrial glycoprotein [Dioscorea alata]|uniref:Mitochondrial glycoprotein n=1 Tax=Dioscorea alata TaxID=55571 RepID=A0ACB7VWZ9_DIOAL|nr:Mitochondrial glycoprotein [Dioscorea alata]
MSLRQLYRRSRALLRDGDLLQAVRAELAYELSSPPSSPPQSIEVGGTVDGFVLECDDPKTKDVFLRKSDEEEVAVSAKLGRLFFGEENAMDWNVRMKVCVKRPKAEPLLHFDCSVFAGEGFGSSDFRIRCVSYHSSQDSLEALKYRGPKFRSLDPNLQGALKEYLIARGVGAELTDFLLKRLHSKDQNQYVTWLRTMESLLANQP